MKKPTKKKLRKTLWDLTSEYIRRKYADDNGYCSCVTCGMTKHWKEMQAGHFIPKAQGNAIYFVEENIHPQCYRCNMNLGGNGPEYTPFMELTYGKEKVDELRKLAATTVKFTISDYQDMIKETKRMMGEL